MRRARGLSEYSRREFCGAAAAGCLGLAASACTDGSVGAINTGPLGGGPDAGKPPPDGHQQGGDGSVSIDAPTGVACTSTPVDVGPASGYSLNTPQYFSSGKFFVVKDAGGFYAITAICTHEGATNSVSSGRFRCPRHGALFTLNGDIISGPVITGLIHYGMCNMSNGNLGVITSSHVAQSTRISG